MHLSPMSRSRQHRAAFGTTDRRPNLFSPSAVMSPGLRTGSTSRIARTAASLLTIAAVAFPIASSVLLLDRTPAEATVVPPTAYVTNFSSSVTPIATATNTPGTPITVGIQPRGIAITPDGKTAYVANQARQRDPDRHGHQHRRDADHRGQPAPTASPSPPTARPPMSRTSATAR